MDSKTTLTIIALALLLIVGSRTGTEDRLGRLDAISPSDVTLLARLIDAEARGEPYTGKVAVGAVVVNRYLDNRYPNSIREIIYEPNQFYAQGIPQFPVPSDESRRAAEAAVRGEDPTGGALFFYNPKTARLAPWWNSRKVLIQIGNHVFLK